MASTKGLERGPADRKGKYDFGIQNRGQWGTDIVSGVVSNASPLPAAAKFVNFWDGTTACVCSGAVQSFTTFIGILKEDVANGETASFVTCLDDIYLPAFVDDTFAAGTVVYWDATNYRVTTTSSGNIKIGISLAAELAVSSDVLAELPTGTWVRVNVEKHL